MTSKWGAPQLRLKLTTFWDSWQEPLPKLPCATTAWRNQLPRFRPPDQIDFHLPVHQVGQMSASDKQNGLLAYKPNIFQVWSPNEDQPWPRHSLHAQKMQEIWKPLGINAKFYISYHLMASDQVEWTNQTIANLLKKYVATNQKNWDVNIDDNQIHTPQIHRTNTIQIDNKTTNYVPSPLALPCRGS